METHSSPTCAHRVRLFDSARSRASGIARYLREGLESGGNVLVVATPGNWRAAAKELEAAGIQVEQAQTDGRLTVLDAADTLRQFMRGNAPDATKLQEVVGSLVARLAEQPGRLHIYGEMVDVLAETGNYRGAHRLEELWNGLASRLSFDLFCGYTSGHFGDHRAATALRAICAAHSHVHSEPDDELGRFLTAQANLLPEGGQALPWRFTPGAS